MMPKPNQNNNHPRDTSEFQGFSSEKVLIETRPNFWLYSNNFILKIVVLFLLIFMFSPIMAFIYTFQAQLISRFSVNISNVNFYAELVLIFCILIVIVKLALDVLDWNYTRYVLTDHRIVIERGFIRKEKVSMPYGKIQDIELSQSFLERIISVGDIILYGANEVSETILDNIPHPREAEEIILTRMNANSYANQNTFNNYPNNPQPNQYPDQNMQPNQYMNNNQTQYTITPEEYTQTNIQYDDEEEVHYFNDDLETITPEHNQHINWDKKSEERPKQEWNKEEVFRKHDAMFKKHRK